MNTCDVEEGTTVAVFGLGAVGLAAVQVSIPLLAIVCLFVRTYVLRRRYRRQD